MSDSPRLVVFTPLPPQRSGIAAYNRELLLPALATRADVLAVTSDDNAPLGAAGSAVAVVGHHEYQRRFAADRRSPIYHVGNNLGLHGWIHDAALRAPGLGVLHDPCLLDFYLEYHGGAHGFSEEIRHNYGDVAVDAGGGSARVGEGVDRLALRLERRVAEASRGLIVHSPWAAAVVAERCPTAAVYHVPLAAELTSGGERGHGLRRRLGWSDDNVVFTLPGALASHKRTAYAAQLFGAVANAVPTARLLVVGRSDKPAVLEAVEAALDEAGVAPLSELVVDVSHDEFGVAMDASDVIVDLRWPSAGEVPASLLQAFGAGKPAVVSDLPQLRHFDSGFCWRVPTDQLVGSAPAIERMVRAAQARGETREAGRRARAYVEAECTPDRVADAYLEILEEVDVRPPATFVFPDAPGRDRGVALNIIGDFEATTGLMEAGRHLVSSLAGTDVDLALTAVDSWAERSPTRRYPAVTAIRAGRPHAIDLWLFNINEFPIIADATLRPDDRARYTVANWFWELTVLPDPLPEQLHRVDEVWVASRFVRETLRAAAPPGLPIHVMPCAVEAPTPPGDGRSRITRTDATTFFFNFDARSTAARKNPWGVINAFAEAFRRGERGRDAALVLKVQHLDYVPDLREPLQAAIDAVGGTLIEGELTRPAMNALLASIDVYVSMHRSEGFGLGIAEAMFLGKPAIATAYSGNMDFTDASNCCLVGYQLRRIEADDHRHLPEGASVYPPGLEWAEPAVDDAARWMQLLHRQPELRRQIGRAGATTIRQRYSRHAARVSLIRRLEEIQDRSLLGATGRTTAG